MADVVYEHERRFPLTAGGRSLLELALEQGIPHAHACGGNARCSTCRVLVLSGAERLGARTEAEQELADRKGLEDEVRLACQATVNGDVRVRRLVRDRLDEQMASQTSCETTGRESEIAVLFSDIRDFTPFVERNLAYDVVHALNRYFQAVGEPILAHEGHIDKYMGDGILALFGLDHEDAALASRQAVRAGLAMLKAVDCFNDGLEEALGVQFRIGVGIHVGEAIVGSLGHVKRMQLSAIGDTVNVAARIEAATKEHGARLLVSEALHAHVADEVEVGRRIEARLKGKRKTQVLFEILGARTGA